MSLDTRIAEFVVNEQADLLAKHCDGGYLDVMTEPRPDNVEDHVTTQLVLATMIFGTPAFLKAKGGVISANPISSGIGLAFGKPRWFRAWSRDHKTAIFDGSAGKAKDNNMVLPADTIVEGVVVGCSGLTHTVRKSTPGI